jgi:hypothetical protein
VRPSAFLFAAICSAIEERVNMNLIYKVFVDTARTKPDILGVSRGRADRRVSLLLAFHQQVRRSRYRR